MAGEMNMLGGQLSLEVPSTKLPGTAWFIQISDIHLSKFDHLPDRQKLYGDKAGDLRCTLLASRQAACLMYLSSDVQLDHFPDHQGSLLRRLFARTVLAASQPGALLITGDLTDGKRLIGTGEQQLQEWQVTQPFFFLCCCSL